MFFVFLGMLAPFVGQSLVAGGNLELAIVLFVLGCLAATYTSLYLKVVRASSDLFSLVASRAPYGRKRVGKA